MEDANKLSRTELDSHANIPVTGRNAYILSKIGETVDVAPFMPDYKAISVELVDAALKYECPYSGKVKILIIRRGLYVPSMTNNLLPPCMLREAGIHINENCNESFRVCAEEPIAPLYKVVGINRPVEMEISQS